jgi:hypothetical protein
MWNLGPIGIDYVASNGQPRHSKGDGKSVRRPIKPEHAERQTLANRRPLSANSSPWNDRFFHHIMTYPPLGESWPLPSRTEIGLDHRGVSTWDLLLSAEQVALALPKPTAKYQDKLVAVRLLGWFLKDFWENQRSTAYSRLLLEINSCNRASESVGSAERL